MRTYERGVENETLACGTGATATALAAHRMNLINSTTIPVRVAGGELEISFNADESGFSNVKLKGPATFVFSGEISL
jgi:diaminopimelate epimerase